MVFFAFASALPLRSAPCPRAAAPAAVPRFIISSQATPTRRARAPTARTNDATPLPVAAPAPDAVPADAVFPAFAFDLADAGAVLASALTLALVLTPEAANAVPDAVVATFKTKPASLIHPGVMWTVFGSATYAFYLGWQSRQIRSAEPERRKELVKSKVTGRHFSLASQLFATMTFFTFFGMANTFTRTGKLFPGPHLYNGLGLVALLATMTALVPQMQSGKLWAKNTHFALAFPALFLFAWQAKSGMDIVAKLLGWA